MHLIHVAGVALIVGLALCACRSRAEPAARSLTAVKVRTVGSSRPDAAARYSANIEPASRVDLVFKVSGYVETIAKAKGVDGKPRLLQEGDRVSRGMELATIRKQDHVNKLAEADAALGEAMAAREQSQLDFDRATKLHAGDSIAKADLDVARVKLQAVSARVEGSRVRVDEARAMLADTSLRSPMDGIVLKRTLEVGALAGPSVIAFVIADVDSMKAVFGVPDTVRPLLALGSSQRVTSEAFANEVWSGRITRLAAVADPRTRLFEVEVTIHSPSQKLRAGLVASLQLTAAGAADAVTVLPLSAVVRSPRQADEFAVFALDETHQPPTVRLRDVQLGQFLGNLIPVRAGLVPGEKIVVQGASLLSDREAVRVIP